MRLTKTVDQQTSNEDVVSMKNCLVEFGNSNKKLSNKCHSTIGSTKLGHRDLIMAIERNIVAVVCIVNFALHIVVQFVHICYSTERVLLYF